MSQHIVSQFVKRGPYHAGGPFTKVQFLDSSLNELNDHSIPTNTYLAVKVTDQKCTCTWASSRLLKSRTFGLQIWSVEMGS